MLLQKRLQLTLAILKPDLTQRPYAIEHVRSLLLNEGFIAIQSQIVQLPKSKVELFYEEHKERFFYNRLVTYMSSATSHIHILARQDDAIHRWRALLGPTKVTALSRHNTPGIPRVRYVNLWSDKK